MPTIPRTCTFYGCDRPHRAKGLCATHYYQQRRGVPLTPIVPQPHRKQGMTLQQLADWILSRCKRTEAGCMEWQGQRRKTGYGTVGFEGKHRRTHRIVLRAYRGDPLPGMEARHSCDNPPCCNPAHLTWGTRSENLIDRTKRTATRTQKLTADQVLDIRKRLQSGETHQRIADDYGVARRTIGKIKLGERWAWLR